MSGLILRTPTDVLRVWRSDDGELPAAAIGGLRAFYRQAPSRQLQLDLGARLAAGTTTRGAPPPLLTGEGPGAPGTGPGRRVLFLDEEPAAQSCTSAKRPSQRIRTRCHQQRHARVPLQY
jgi:hypothetical protein